MSDEVLLSSSDKLRRRFPELAEDVCDDCNSSTDSRESSNVSSSSKSNKRVNTLSRFDLESLLWILICAVMMYYTDFWTTVMYDMRVKRTYFYASISLFTVAVMMMTYCMMKMPTLNYNNWSQEGPVIVPTMTVIVILGSLCLIMSLWPIWGLITPIILFIVLMAFISLLVTVG